MAHVEIRCYEHGSVIEQTARTTFDTVRNILSVAGFKTILANDTLESMQNQELGIDILIEIENL